NLDLCKICFAFILLVVIVSSLSLLKVRKEMMGMKGDQGDPGPLGMKGDHGMKGDKGHQGSDGPQGELGPQGEPGVCPERCDFFRGLPGHSGMPGPSGLRGLPGTQGEPGPKGEKGDLGHIGLPGGRGADGPKGDRGAQGECHCQDGAKGSDGQVGNPGLKGDLGQTGPQGTTGTMGRKGEKGEVGTMGEPGPCSPAIQSAFSATLGSSNPSSDMPVPFNRIVYNIQQNYNPNGIYTAPINGTYIFSYNLAINSKPLKVGLFQNFLPIVRSTAMTLGSTTNQQVVLHLKMGDMVWIQVKDNQYNGIYTSSECNSIFSGLLLYPDSCNMIMSREFPEPGSGIFSWGPEEDPTDVVEMTVP
uniref:C1q domain-containing protein n=2 Tax=Denticeps clupeoides TaxID=299321 RepID=A0AAY4EDF8_9TELE